jgi:lipoyl(octanoyl) transferase
MTNFMTWRLLSYRICNIFENMAIDEAIFQETIKNKKAPTIRFYGSYPAAVTIGYFQDIRKEVNIEKCRMANVDVVRRITGGKAVFHFDEITYCVVAGDWEKLFPLNIMGTYEIISQCIARGLIFLGIKADLAKTERMTSDEEIKSFCFSTPSKSELLVKGRKICGSAQVRRKGGFLQHGSLLLAFDVEKTASLLLPEHNSYYCKTLKKSVTAIDEEGISPVKTQDICLALKNGFIQKLGIKLSEDKLTPAEENLKNELLKKYNSTNWNMDRKEKEYNK